MPSRCLPAALVVLLVVLARPASATTLVTFNGDGYQDGSVTYSISGNTLTITLANTAVYSTGKVAPSDVLTGVIFTLPTGISLVPLTATIDSGSTIDQADTCNPGPCTGTTTNVAGEFGYDTSPFPGENAPEGYNAGIGSAGQIAGSGSLFPGGTNLDDPNSPNGLNFGIVGANYTSSMGNAKVQSEPLISNAVTFTLTIVGGTLLESEITNWALVFGTDWTVVPADLPPPPDTAVPEPSTLILLGSGFTVLAATLRRRRLKSNAR